MTAAARRSPAAAATSGMRGELVPALASGAGMGARFSGRSRRRRFVKTWPALPNGDSATRGRQNRDGPVPTGGCADER